MKCGIGLVRRLAKANRLALALFIVVLGSCQTGTKDPNPFDWQGHRGARGEAPENTTAGMIRALQEGVRTLEMDVVISKDSVVLLSHEPYFNKDICSPPGGQTWADTVDLNIFHFEFDQIALIDCGSKPYDRFPAQEHFFAAKPSLIEVISEAEESAIMMNRDEPSYNIEIKSRPEWDNIYHPSVEVYCDLVLETTAKASLGDRLIIQSFDGRALQYIHEQYPQIRLAYLTEDGERSAAEQIKALGFVPEIYSCDFKLLNEMDVKNLKTSGMKVIPWTVNEIEDAERLRDWGVDGLITDYPARMLSAIGRF